MIKRHYTLLSLAFLVLLAACGSEQPPYQEQGIKIGKPYEIAGQIYIPRYNPGYDETGVASWYGPGFHGGRTASGERFDQDDMTAAHKTLPLPCIVRVTNLDNGRSVLVRVNDRGPFVSGSIDLSRAAAFKLGMHRLGTAKVRVQYLDAETRDYVSRLPNGKASLIALDRSLHPGETLADAENQETIINSSVLAVDKSARNRHENTENMVTAASTETAVSSAPLPFVAPVVPVPHVETVASQTPDNTNGAVNIPQIREPVHRGEAMYFIQAGTFGVKDNADRLLEELEEMGSAKIVENNGRAKKLYRVLAGPYNSNMEARNMLGRLGNIGISGAKIVKG